MTQDAVLDPLSLAELAYKVAEVTGADSELVRLLAEAAESGDEDVAALAWDAFLELPAEIRRYLAHWFAQLYPSDGRTLAAVLHWHPPGGFHD